MATALPSALVPTPLDTSAVPSQLEARRHLMRGLEADYATLRRLDRTKRLAELAFFFVLWLAGMALNLGGQLQTPGLAHAAARVAGTLLTAVAINTFILLMHEGMHNILFANRVANRWVSDLLGLTFIMSFTSYRVMHLRHHQYLGEAGDPDDYSNYTQNRLVLWCLHYLRLLVGVYVYIIVIPFLAFRHGTTGDRWRILEEYAVLIAVYAVVAWLVPGRLLLTLWFIPLVIAAHMTAVRGLTQHGITNAKDPYLASRTIQASPIVAFCLLNENFHLEHHLFPEVPSYHLAALHKLIWPRLPRAVTGRSYLGFLGRFLLGTLRLDERPIGLTEMLGWEA